jgi:hypothetical protein
MHAEAWWGLPVRCAQLQDPAQLSMLQRLANEERLVRERKRQEERLVKERDKVGGALRAHRMVSILQQAGV